MPFQAFKTLQNSPLKPIMVLVGSEFLLREKMREQSIERALQGALREMNYAKFRLSESSLQEALEACQDFPCFSERRVVALQEIEAIKKNDAAPLIHYLENPAEKTLLIIEAEKLDGRLDWT